MVEDAHPHAPVAQALQRRGDARRLGVLDVEVVDRDRDVRLRRREERDQRARDVGHRLAALAQEAQLDRAAHRGAPPQAMAQTSAGESTTCRSARSSSEIIPSASSRFFIQSSRPLQYSEP